jgi:hypothetical protein
VSAPAAAAFEQSFGPVADAVAAGTGIDRTALLIQWAVETAYGQQINNQNNLGNIRCLHAGIWGFCQYGSLGEFAAEAIATWTWRGGPGNPYAPVLATAGQPLEAQLRAIGASPWDAGHYDNGGGPGSSLLAIEGEFSLMLTLQMKRALVRMAAFLMGRRAAEIPEAWLESVAVQIADDGSNVDGVIANLVNSAEAGTYLTRLHLVLDAGPAGAGTAGPQGQKGDKGDQGDPGPPLATGATLKVV